jgi:dTDP-4-dehydrorhamnose reductase
VINVAAYNLVDRAEEEPEVAYRVNALGPRNLALSCGEIGATLFHVSTDFIFGLDTDRKTPYRELDAPGPLSAYGLSKLAGEYFVRSLCPRHFVMRTCGLYGIECSRGKGNFVETMLRLGAERDSLNVVNDQRCTPSWTMDIAHAILALLETDQYGLYHATNSGSMTWYEFAAEIFGQAGITVELHPITSDQFGAAAQRPGYSVLDCQKLAEATGLKLPPWQKALAGYLQQRPKRNG